MTTIDIYSGFLGAGKTTLIKKMIREAYQGEKIVLIENEFGEIGIDGGFMQDAGIQVNEMNSGCICCSLVGDFGRALKQVISDYHPDRILIEPSGVGKLSDVIGAVERVADESVTLGSFITVADATKCKVYLKNFGEFYTNQIETASAIILSRTGSISEEKLAAAVALLREHNQNAVIITTPWDQLSGAQILEAMQKQHTLTEELADMIRSAQSEEDDEDEEEEHHHHDDDDEDDEHEHHCCHHHDDDDDEDASSATAITIMTTMKTMMSMSTTAAIITTMTTMTRMRTSTTAATITIITTATTPTRSSRAGASRRRRSSPRKRCTQCPRRTGRRRDLWHRAARQGHRSDGRIRQPGCTLTMCPARSTSAPARPL